MSVTTEYLFVGDDYRFHLRGGKRVIGRLVGFVDSPSKGRTLHLTDHGRHRFVPESMLVHIDDLMDLKAELVTVLGKTWEE